MQLAVNNIYINLHLCIARRKQPAHASIVPKHLTEGCPRLLNTSEQQYTYMRCAKTLLYILIILILDTILPYLILVTI
jgi:hypothetical protein